LKKRAILEKSISEAINDFIRSVQLARSPRTAATYRNALVFYQNTLRQKNIEPEQTSIRNLSEDSILWMTNALKNHAATSERLYLTALTGFFEYLVSERLVEINLPRVRLLIQQRARKPGQRLPQFPASLIDQILKKLNVCKAKTLTIWPTAWLIYATELFCTLLLIPGFVCTKLVIYVAVTLIGMKVKP